MPACPDYVLSTSIPDEYKGLQKKDVVIKLIERLRSQGLSEKEVRECAAVAVLNWFSGVKSMESARGYVRSVISRYMRKAGTETETGKESGSAGASPDTSGPSSSAEGVPSELLIEEPEGGEEEEDSGDFGEESEAGGGFSQISIDEKDIIMLYGSIWEAVANYFGKRVDEVIPEERIRTTGKYLYHVLRKVGVLDAEAFIFTALAINIAGDVAIVMRRLKQQEEEERPAPAPSPAPAEQEVDMNQLKKKLAKAWRKGEKK